MIKKGKKLTENQRLFKKEISLLKRRIREAESKGYSFKNFSFNYDMPKTVRKRDIERVRNLRKEKLYKYAEFIDYSSGEIFSGKQALKQRYTNKEYFDAKKEKENFRNEIDDLIEENSKQYEWQETDFDDRYAEFETDYEGDEFYDDYFSEEETDFNSLPIIDYEEEIKYQIEGTLFDEETKEYLSDLIDEISENVGENVKEYWELNEMNIINAAESAIGAEYATALRIGRNTSEYTLKGSIPYSTNNFKLAARFIGIVRAIRGGGIKEVDKKFIRNKYMDKNL